jgi:NADH dehydrogenase
MAEPGDKAPHVLILGGGYVAITVCRALRRSVREGKVRVTVVSRENFHPFHGFIAEMVTGRISASHMLSPARRVFPGANLHVAEIERIDLEARSVTVSRHLDGRRSQLTYDELVLAVGTRDNLEAYPGLAEHAFRLRAYEDDLRLRNHILMMFELADIEPDAEERRRLLTFFVAGGGFAGTELAGELADHARRLIKRDFPRIDRGECRVVLVEPGATILPELYGGDGTGKNAFPRLVEKALARHRQLGVEVLTQVLVEAVTPTEVRLSTGERIPTRTVVSAVGMKPQPIVTRLGLDADRRGRIVTDEMCRIPDRPGLWAAGDCAAVPKPGGGTCPPVALYALKQGAHLGRNIARQLAGEAPTRFRWPGIGQAASVGNRYAVGELKGIQVWGLPAWLLWRGFLFRYFPSWEGRLRMLADWVIWPLVGRDIVELRPKALSSYDITANVFQPGEVVVRERQAGRYIHIILEGEVEICLEDAPEGDALALLGPGDHFGQRWTESFQPELARTRTVVRTIALSREQAPRLQEALKSTGLLVRDSGHFPAIDPRDPPPEDAVTPPA